MKSLKEAKAQFRRILYLLAGFSFVVNIMMLTMPLYMLQIYDRILPSKSMDTLTFLSIIAGAALVVLGLIEAVRAVLASRAAARMEAILGADALRVSMQMSRMGEADIQPMRDMANIRSFVSSRAVFSLLDMPFAPLFIGILYFIHPTLFWLTLGGAVVLFFIAILNQWLTNEPSTIAGSRQGAAMMTAQSMSRNAHALRAMGMTQNAINLWGAHNAESLQAQGRVDTRNAILTGMSRTIRMGLQIAILGVGALLVLKSEMTPGMIFASSIIAGRGLQPIDQVIGGWKQIAMTWRSWQNLQKSLNQAGDEAEKTIMNAPQGTISVEGASVVSAAGISGSPILNRVSFAIQPGEVLAIVGPSGSGKSTLARLLVGAQNPQAGVVRIDGTDIQNWDSTQLGTHIGYLGQEMELLPGTVSQNIARLAQVPDDNAVLEAAQKARVHGLIQGLPQGYDTLIGPGGMGLSGGQRQRVGLARAFYGNPQIMILDEPNANLDDDGELALHQAIMSARQSGVTIVLITQRKQVLNGVDKILRLHQGNVDFMGTRDEFAKALQGQREKSKTGRRPQERQQEKKREDKVNPSRRPKPALKDITPDRATKSEPPQARASPRQANEAPKRQLPGSPFAPPKNINGTQKKSNVRKKPYGKTNVSYGTSKPKQEKKN